MPSAAATATGLPVDLATLAGLVLAVLAVTAVYLAVCWAAPYRRCRHCHGTGRIDAPAGRRWRRCRHCDDTGLRLRPGRRALNALRRPR